LPYGGADTNATTINQWDVDPTEHLTQEGVTPAADTIEAQDITVQLNQYACLYKYTDKVLNLYEDDVPKAMKKQTGQRMGLVRELIRYGALKGCTNKFYAGGTSRSAVDEAISLGKLRAVTRSITGNLGDLVSEVLTGSAKYNTAPVEAAFLVFAHTDCENDIRELPGFVPCASYGTMSKVHACELGSCDRYRFILSPHLDPIADAGNSNAAAQGMISTTGTSCDVYPYIIVGEDAWGDVALRGSESFDITDISPGQKDKIDPLGLIGYVGAKFWSAAFVQNDGWMAVLECAATDL